MGKKTMMVMSWMATVGAMKREGTLAFYSCSVCGLYRRVDLDPIIKKFGPEFSLINRRPRCPRCGNRGLFMCASSEKAFRRPCLS